MQKTKIKSIFSYQSSSVKFLSMHIMIDNLPTTKLSKHLIYFGLGELPSNL